MKKIIKAILYLIVFLTPLFYLPLTSSAFAFNKQVLIIVLVLIALLLWLIQEAKQKKLEIRRTSLDYFVLGFLVIYSLSFVFSLNRHGSLLPWLTIVFLGIFYFLVNNVFAKRKKLLIAYLASIFTASVLFLLSVFKIWKFVNPTGSQTSLVVLIAIGILIALKQKSKILSLIFVVFGLFILSLINFQIGWIILALGTLFVLGLAMHKQRTICLWLPIIVLVISLLSLLINLPPIYKTELPIEVSLSKKLSWDISLKTSIKHVFGTGPNNFSYAFSKFRPESFNQTPLWSVRFSRASNQFAQILANTGWLGLLSFASLIVISLLSGFSPILIALIAVAWCASFGPILWLVFFLIIAISTKRLHRVKLPLPKFTSFSWVIGLVLVIILIAFVARLYLAEYYFMKKDYKRAIQHNKNNAFYHLALAQESLSNALVLKEPAEVQVNLTNAINESKKAIDLASNSAAVWQVRAKIFDQATPFTPDAQEWAIKSYEKAIDLEPTNPLLYQELGKIKEDIELLQKAVQLRPQLYVAQYELGRLYYNQNSIDQAIEHFEKAINLSPNYANALYSLGLSYEKKGKKSKALELFKKVLELNPDQKDLKDKIKLLTSPNK